ncbi:hypothetical protein E4U52_002794 [Claviceps spartinae]|nr:hypothetical protein E4U52_002794 [Claviceps spartinae]
MNRMCEFLGWQRGGAKEVRARTRLRQAKLDKRSWVEPKYNCLKSDNVLYALQQPECQRLNTSPVLECPTIAVSEHIDLSASCPVVEMSGPIDLFFNRGDQSDCNPHSKAIKGVYVKIFGFIDSERAGEATHKFASLAHLRRYTENKGEVIPREQAKGSLLLRFLLQVLFGRKKSQ